MRYGENGHRTGDATEKCERQREGFSLSLDTTSPISIDYLRNRTTTV
jgi:hypothetical protein